MWLVVGLVVMVMLGHPGSSEAADLKFISEKAARFVGLGYNLLLADPDAAAGGGVDPGYRVTRRIVDLTTSNQESFPRHSCVQRSSTSTIYDEKSFQKKFDLDVATEAGVTIGLVEAKFSLSASFSRARDQTTKEKKMSQEKQTLCNLGGARLKTELNLHKTSQGFQAAVCQLPDAYQQTSYVKFIDDWGTNFVVEVDVGTRNLTTKTSTFSSVYQSLQQQFGLSAAASGAYKGVFVSVSGSIEVNMKGVENSDQLQKSFTGNEVKKMIGTETYPEPIFVKLGSIESLVSAKYFGTSNPAACTKDAMSKLAIKQANLLRALKEYPLVKKAIVSASDGKVRIPLNWPRGTYGLIKPNSICPTGWASDGIRNWGDSAKLKKITSVTSGYHFDGHFGGSVLLRFCVKTTQVTSVLTDVDWPVGEYCILKYRDCPVGFSKGSIFWHDEADFSFARGTIPDGTYTRDTLIHFCCRTDGHNNIPVFLPTDNPFFLLQASRYGCQKVYGMKDVSEQIQWDDLDSTSKIPNNNKAEGVVPYNMPTSSNGVKDWKLFFCYYSK